MSEVLVPAAAEPVVVADGEADVVLPALIVDAGPDAVQRFLEFFAGRIAVPGRPPASTPPAPASATVAICRASRDFPPPAPRPPPASSPTSPTGSSASRCFPSASTGSGIEMAPFGPDGSAAAKRHGRGPRPRLLQRSPCLARLID